MRFSDIGRYINSQIFLSSSFNLALKFWVYLDLIVVCSSNLFLLEELNVWLAEIEFHLEFEFIIIKFIAHYLCV